MAAYTRDQIIAAIQQATADNGGEPVGFRRFETLTGIAPGAWKGVYWARWTDAQRDAGLEPNTASLARDENPAHRSHTAEPQRGAVVRWTPERRADR